MKSIIVVLASIVFILVGSILYFNEGAEPPFIPLTKNINWDSQETIELANDELSIVKDMVETLAIYEQSIYNNEQTLQIDVLNENLFLNITTMFYDVNTLSKTFNNYSTQTITTDGYELLIDTNGITGELSATTMNYETLDTAFFSSQLRLSNPPFNVQVLEQQQMPLSQAGTQLTNVLNLNLDIDPITIINTINFDASSTSYYKMDYGYLIEADALVTEGLVLGINQIPAQVKMVIYEGYLMTFQISIQSQPVTINNTLIDNGSDTLELMVSLEATYDYDVWPDEVNVPDPSTFKDYEVVDTFTLPDITSIFQP